MLLLLWGFDIKREPIGATKTLSGTSVGSPNVDGGIHRAIYSRLETSYNDLETCSSRLHT